MENSSESSQNKQDKIFGDNPQQIYKARFGGNLKYRKMVWGVLVRDYFQKFINTEDIVLDLGAGYGEFINQISCKKKYAFDLNPETVFQTGIDVEVVTQDCSEPWPLSGDSLDVIFTSNFFEHLADKQALSRTISEASRCLKSGGRLIAIGPNIKYASGAYWDFWDHHIPLTEQSISEGLMLRGFTIEDCVDRFLPFTMVKGPKYPSIFISLYLKIPLAWRIFGKQFLVVAKKT